MRLFTTHQRRDRSTARAHGERALQQILTGPDTAHRRELETMLEDRDQ